MIRTLLFTEDDTSLTYTAEISIPVGARLLDIYVETDVAWTAATAPLDVGDSDASDALCDAGTVDLTGQQGIAGSACAGTDWGNGLTAADGPISNGGPGKLYPSGDTITAVATATVPGGPTGISRIVLFLQVPGPDRQAVGA